MSELDIDEPNIDPTMLITRTRPLALQLSLLEDGKIGAKVTAERQIVEQATGTIISSGRAPRYTVTFAANGQPIDPALGAGDNGLDLGQITRADFKRLCGAVVRRTKEAQESREADNG